MWELSDAPGTLNAIRRKSWVVILDFYYTGGMRAWMLMAAAALVLPAADPLYESTERKLDAIESKHVKPGESVTFTAREINAWARVKVPEIVPDGMRDPRVELGTGTATGYATVDFLKMRQAKGEATNWFLTKLIEGERPLKVAVRLESGGGRCTVFLTRVELSGVAANQTVLDFLVKSFFMPLYPDAKINEQFNLDYDIDRTDLRPAGAVVTIKK